MQVKSMDLEEKHFETIACINYATNMLPDQYI